MQRFEKTVVDIGDIKPGSKGNEIFWTFKDMAKEDIATYNENGKHKYAVKGMCGCTNVQVNDDGISAQYNDDGNKTGTVSKKVQVHLKTDEDIPVRVQKTNSRGVQITDFNKDLPKAILSFTGNVV